MSARKKTKLCWHCHGTITAEATHCAYCGEHCEIHQAAAAPYFPPHAEDKSSAEILSQDQSSVDSASSIEVTWWRRSQKFFTARFFAFLKFLRCEPACAFLCLTWGIFFAFLALFLSLFASGDQLYIVLSTRFWWLYGLVASAMIWIGSLLAKK